MTMFQASRTRERRRRRQRLVVRDAVEIMRKRRPPVVVVVSRSDRVRGRGGKVATQTRRFYSFITRYIRSRTMVSACRLHRTIGHSTVVVAVAVTVAIVVAVGDAHACWNAGIVRRGARVRTRILVAT